MKNDEIEDIFETAANEEAEELFKEDDSKEKSSSQVQNKINNNPILNDKINNLVKNKVPISNLNNIVNKVNMNGIIKKNSTISEEVEEQSETTQENQTNKTLGLASQSLGSKTIASQEADDTLKKELSDIVLRKILTKRIIIVMGISLLIVLLLIIFVLIATTVKDDESEINTSNQIIDVVKGDLTYEEITSYLVYMGICRDLEDEQEEQKACMESGFGKFILEFKDVYKNYQQYLDKNNNPIELDIPLIMETISYERSDNDLINLLSTNEGFEQVKNELYNLAEAQVEYVQEVGDYYNSNCTLTEDKKIGKPYYMISDDKYVSYLKYGKVHENYSGKARIYDAIIHPDSEEKCIPEGKSYTPPNTMRYIGEEIIENNSENNEINEPAKNPGMSNLLKDNDSGMEYYIYRPDGSNTAGKPIIFAFHGTNPTSKEIDVGEFAAYQLVKDGKVTPNAIIVYPTKNYSSSWVRFSSTSAEAIKIAKFIKNIVSSEGADESRVFYYGFSMATYDAANIIKATGIGYFRAAVLNDGTPRNISDNNYLGLKGIYIIEAAENNYSGTSENKANGAFSNFNGIFKLEDHSGKSHAWANGFAIADSEGDALGVWNCNEAGNAFGWLLNNFGNNSQSNTVTGSGIGVEIANYALQFVGNPYVWGGTSLTNGADCSGFTMKVFEHFGISLPHYSISQANYGKDIGTDVKNAIPGDLIVYNHEHVAIYIGNNRIVHAASKKTGIKIGDKADYKSILSIRRLVE